MKTVLKLKARRFKSAGETTASSSSKSCKLWGHCYLFLSINTFMTFFLTFLPETLVWHDMKCFAFVEFAESRYFSYFQIWWKMRYWRVSAEIPGNIYFLQKQPPEVFYRQSVLKNFAVFAEKHLCWSLFWITLQACERLYLFLAKYVFYALYLHSNYQ